MRLVVASAIFLIASLDMNFGIGETRLQIAALIAAILLALSVAADHLWFDRPARPKPHESDQPVRS
jgi:hypothetical protein